MKNKGKREWLHVKYHTSSPSVHHDMLSKGEIKDVSKWTQTGAKWVEKVSTWGVQGRPQLISVLWPCSFNLALLVRTKLVSCNCEKRSHNYEIRCLIFFFSLVNAERFHKIWYWACCFWHLKRWPRLCSCSGRSQWPRPCYETDSPLPECTTPCK